MNKIIITALALIFVAGACNPTPVKPVINDVVTLEEIPSEPTSRTVEFVDVGSAFKFSGELPVDWQVEYVVGTDALNIYDPSDVAESNLEKSQIFILTHYTFLKFCGFDFHIFIIPQYGI